MSVARNVKFGVNELELRSLRKMLVRFGQSYCAPTNYDRKYRTPNSLLRLLAVPHLLTLTLKHKTAQKSSVSNMTIKK